MRPTVKKMFAEIREHGPITAIEAGEAAGLPRYAAYDTVRKLHEDGAIYISDYVKRESSGFKRKRFVIVPLYVAGAGADAVRPQPKRVRKAPAKHVSATPAPGAETRKVMAAARRVLKANAENPFASMLGQMGAA